jgi:hypothetical protein
MKSRLVCGVGINDVPGYSKLRYADPFYVAWAGMLKRCYSPKYLERYPAYKGCSVAPEWLRFSSFKDWMTTQHWNGMVLDKDLLVLGNKIYGPDTCLFIPDWLNVFLSSLTPPNRELPMGVTRRGNRYRSRYSLKYKPVNLGQFDAPGKAHLAYRAYRLTVIQERLRLYMAGPNPCQLVSNALHNLYETECCAVKKLHLAGINAECA